jgi:hypothetical protein
VYQQLSNTYSRSLVKFEIASRTKTKKRKRNNWSQFGKIKLLALFVKLQSSDICSFDLTQVIKRTRVFSHLQSRFTTSSYFTLKRKTINKKTRSNIDVVLLISVTLNFDEEIASVGCTNRQPIMVFRFLREDPLLSMVPFSLDSNMDQSGYKICRRTMKYDYQSATFLWRTWRQEYTTNRGRQSNTPGLPCSKGWDPGARGSDVYPLNQLTHRPNAFRIVPKGQGDSAELPVPHCSPLWHCPRKSLRDPTGQLFHGTEKRFLRSKPMQLTRSVSSSMERISESEQGPGVSVWERWTRISQVKAGLKGPQAFEICGPCTLDLFPTF